jgi:hypothetical protein
VADPLQPAREQELLRSANARRTAPTTELVSLVAGLEAKRDNDASLLAAEFAQADKPDAPNWEDVLAVLGRKPEDPAALKREINRLTQRFRRLLARVRERFEVERSADGA